MRANLLNNLSKGMNFSLTRMRERLCEMWAAMSNHAIITQLSRNNHPIAHRCIRYATALLVVLMVGFGEMWGTSFTPAQIVASGGTTDGNIKVSTVFSTATNKQFCSSESGLTCVNVNNSAGGSYDTYYIEIAATTGYSLSTCSLKVASSSTSSTKGVVAFWNGAASGTCSSYAEFDAPGYSNSTCSNTIISVPSGTKTIRIYRKISLSKSDDRTFAGSTKTDKGGTTTHWLFGITASATSTGRAYDGTEKMFFLRDSWSWWKDGSAKFYAYFWNSSTGDDAWSGEASWVVQTTSENKDVWGYTVPEGTWDKVIITRGSAASFDDGKTWNKSNDITLEATTNLLTDWTVSGETGHAITWSNITLDGKTVYFDNRNYSTWTSAYVRIGKSDHNAAWGPMTKVGGTKYLYEKETDQYDFHTDLSVADSYGWTNGNNIYQPWENQSWSAPAKISKQTTYQKFGVQRDVYLCPTSTSMLERECQYYNVNGGTSTNTFDNVNTGTVLPQYEVTASGTNCTVSLVEYTADDFSASNNISSGDAVDPTRYVGVTVTPNSGYEFSSVTLTEDAFEQHTAAAAGVTGKYAILADCEISASCAPETYTITYKDGGGADVPFSGYHIGTPPTSHTYGTATSLKKAVKSGYVFGGWFDNSSCTGDALTSVGATAKTADFTLYAKWTAMSLVDLESGVLYTASKMVPEGVSLTSGYQYYPGVSADQRFNVIGTGVGSSSTGPMGAKKNTVTYGGTDFNEVMNFDKTASPTDAVPAHHALQFKIPAAGQLEIWVNSNSNIFLSNGTTEYAVNAEYKILTVTTGTWYLYAKAGSKVLGGIRYKKTHSVSAVTSTGDDTKGTVSAAKTTLAEDSSTVITAVPATGYQVTNWAKSGTGASISPSGSSSSLTTTLTMGTANATVTVTFGAIDYTITHSDPTGDGTYTISVAGGSAVSTNTTANYGQTITLAATPGEGYEFTSWTVTGATSGDAITVTSNQFAMPAENVTVTATFTATATYTVTYKANGGTGDDVVDDAATSVASNAFTAPATKAFVGWNTESDGTGTPYAVGDAVSADLTLYAQWKYKVYYIGNTVGESNDITTALSSNYVVSVKTTTGTSFNASDYSDYALIVLSEKLSGTDAETSDHELRKIIEVNKPILNLKSYFYGSKRWNWGTPNAGKKPKNMYVKNDVYANLTSHPIFTDLTITSDSISVLSTVSTTKPLQPVGSFVSGKEGYTLAKVPNNSSGSGTAIHEMTASQRSTATGQSITAKYLLISIQGGELSNLSADGKKLIQNAADYLIKGSQWVPQYAITKSATDGSIATEVSSSAVTSAAAGTRVDITATPSEGYVFSSWSVYKTGDAETTVSTNAETSPTYFMMPAYPVTVSATFALDGHTVTYADGGADSGDVPEDNTLYSEGDEVTVLDNTDLEKTGHSFGGWTANVNLTIDDATVTAGTTIDAGAEFEMPDEDVTLTAVWTPNTYDITYNLNSGSWASSAGASSYTYGVGYTLPTDVTRDGYRFMGWYADDEFEGDRVYTIANNVTGDKEYWAKWAKIYAITDGDPSNGSLSITDGSSAITEAIEGETVYIVATPSTGYNFDAWNIYKTGTPATTVSPAAAAASTSFTMPAYAVTVDATFAEVTYSLSYSIGTGATGAASGGTSAGSYAEGTTITTPAKGTLANEGYTFRGWTDGTTFYTAGQSFSMPANNVTLSAVWESNSAGSTTYYYGSVAISAGALVRGMSGAAVQFFTYSSSTFANSTDISLTTAPSAVAFYCNSNDVSDWTSTSNWTTSSSSNKYISGVDFVKDGSYTLALGTKVASSITFIGFSNQSGDRTMTIGGVGFTQSSQSTFYSHEYTKDGGFTGNVTITETGSFRGILIITCESGSSNFTVSFNDQTGFAGSSTLPDDIVGVPSGKKVLQPSDPEADGYVFSGWYSNAACTAGNEIDWSTMTISADKTIYAKWCVAHTITWVVNGETYTAGTPTTATTDCDGITTMPTAPADNTLSGCANSFRGWSGTNLYGEATTTQPADLFVTAADAPTINADKTFYAVFGTATSAAYIGTVLWSEDWTGESNNATPSGPTTGGGYAIAGASIEYKYTDGTGDNYATTKVATGTNAGGVSPELMVGYGTTTAGAFIVEGLPKKGAKELTLIFKRNNSTTAALTPSVSGEGYSISKVSGSGAGTYVYTITCGAGSTFDLTFTGSTTKDKSVRIDDIVLKVKTDGATNYRCICPSLSVTPKLVTASTPIFITSAAEKTVRSQDSLLIVGSGLAKSTAVSITTTNGTFVLKSRTNGNLTTDATGAIDTVAYIYYTPGEGDTSDGLDKNNSFTITDGTNSETVSTALIGRHLPANFVIAVYKNSKWWALPANHTNGTPAPVEIEVDNTSAPTTAITAEANAYSLGANVNKITTGDGQYVRLGMHGISPTGGSGLAPLQGGSDSKLGQSGNSTMTGNLGPAYWWAFTQKNTSTISSTTDVYYYMSCPNNNDGYRVRLYTSSGDEKWGQYSGGSDEIRLLTWEPSGYDITNGNPTGGTIAITDGSSDITLAEEGATVYIEAEAANGYTFDSWSVTETESGDDVTLDADEDVAENSFTMPDAAVTVDATFTPNTYDITYHLNGASWASSAGVASYTVGTGATLPLAGAMTNVGYTFDGWYANADLSTGGVKTEISTSDYGNKEYWAKWTENTYTLSYDANGGTGTMADTTGHYVTIKKNGFTAPSGKIFAGWNTLSTGSGVSYNEGDEVELTAALKLYAIWAGDYDITWGDVQLGGVDATPNLGGKNYTIVATIDDWDGDTKNIELGDVTEGVTASITGTTATTVTITFAVGADVEGDAISLSINVPAHGDFGAKTSTEDIDIERCVSAATTLFSLEVKASGSDVKVARQGGTLSLTTADYLSTLTGGTAELINGNTGSGDPEKMIGTESSTYQIRFAHNAHTLHVTLSAPLAAGDSIKFTHTTNNTIYFTTVATRSTDTAAVSKVYVVPAGSTFVGKSNIYLWRNSGTTCIKTLKVIRPREAETISPTLTWTPTLAEDGDWVTDHLEKETGDADFTFTVTQDKNSAGAITYASSNTDVATVNSTTGKVHIAGAAGNATITATMAESGCYEEATATYNIAVVDNCDDVPGTIETTDLGCSGTQMTVSGHTGEGAGATYQWYKDGASIGGATSATYTATAAGEYYVVVTNTGDGHCAMTSTNTIVVEALSGKQATRLQTEWYVKNGRRTPDIALVQTGNAKKFIVKNGETVLWDSSDGDKRTGFGGCGFYLGDDEIIYLKGTQDDGSAPSGLTGSTDVTLTIKTVYCDDAEKDNSVTIHCQAATSYKEVAFVVDGTEGGNWNAVTDGHADGTALYEYLDTIGTAASARKFQLTERNIYKTVDDSVLREHYSQFDAILITDNPSTDKKSGKKSYVDAFGTMIDIRPILTMEAYVSKLSNWKAKGINGSPTSPNPRQYGMKLECKNHEIFAGLNESSSNIETEKVDGVTYWTVLMVDSTKSPYTGVAYNVDTKGDQKPALQGFSASDVSGLMLLGQISDGTLFAGVERQDEPAARLLLLGVNAKALPNALTPEGKRVIANALSYLCKTNMEDVDDCSTYFTGKAGTTDWNTGGNWSKGVVPNSPMLKVRILKPCVVPTSTKVRISHLDIVVGGTSKEINTTPNGSLTIPASSAVVVDGTVNRVKAPYYGLDDLMPTEAEDLKIEADEYHTGALIFDNEDGDTKATVEMYSPSYWEVDNVTGKKKKYWSYVGVPIQEVDIPNYFYLGFTYLYDETSGWIKMGDGSELHPFEGIGLSMQSGHKETFYGTLASTETREITLTKTAAGGNGENLIGNSWTAPIQIANFDAEDFGDATATVYVYNTGRDASAEGSYGDESSTTPGQWVSVPVETAKGGAYDGLKVIPAMNAFQVNTTTETTLTLDYDKLVRKGASANDLNDPMRAPRRQAAGTELEAMMRVRVSGTKTHTDVWLQQDNRFTDAFDNGWEAKYAECDNRSAQFYAQSEIGNMAFLALPDLEGTVLGFAPSRDGNEYTFTFHYVGEETFYLNDLKLVRSAFISEEGSYTFTYEEGDTNRFYISRQAIDAPAVTTGVDPIHTTPKAQKILYQDKLYILYNGRVFDATGKVVK